MFSLLQHEPQKRAFIPALICKTGINTYFLKSGIYGLILPFF